jgi:hypothetical protein
MLCDNRRAPDGYTFHDIEEEYVVDPMTGEARWQQVKPGKQRAAAADVGGGGTGRQQRAAKRKPKAAGSEDEEEDFEGITDSD